MALTPEERKELEQLRRERDAAGIKLSESVDRKSKQKNDVEPSTKLERFGTGMADPIHGGAQFLTNILPEGVVEAGNKLNNWMADKGLPVARIPEGGVNEMVANREQQYQDERAAAGSEGVDWMRLLGNVASPVNAAVASRIPAAGSLLTRTVGGAGGGVALSALNPTEGEYWPEKLKQMAVGGVTGGALPLVGEGSKRIFSGVKDPAKRLLMKEGTTLTPGQIVGGRPRRWEEVLDSVPFVGGEIRDAKIRGIEQFNRSAINRALSPIKEKLPKGVQAGHDAIAYAQNKLSDAYDDVLGKMHGQIDKQFNDDLTNVARLAGNLPKDKADELRFLIDEDIVNKFPVLGKGQWGRISGDTVKDIQETLRLYEQAYKNKGPYERKIGQAVKELRRSFDAMLRRTNPKEAEALKAVDAGWANFKRVQKAASKTSGEGVFTPSRLGSVVRSMDANKGSGAAKGQALMQDLTRAGEAVLPNRLPNSGTADRNWGARPIQSALMLAPGVAAKVAYSQPVLGALNYLARGAPQSVTNNIQKALPYATPGVIPLSVLASDKVAP